MMLANTVKINTEYQQHGHDQLVENDLVESHLVMVKRIAYHLKSKLPEQVHVEDLIQAGMLGLIASAKKFDMNQGASFETYAGIRVRGAMLDEIRKYDWTPRSVHRNTRMVTEVVTKIENEKGRKSTVHEVADELGVTIDEYHHMLMDTCNHRVLSFEDYGFNDESIIENVANQEPMMVDNLHSKEMSVLIADCIAQLPKKESLVMSLYYEEELNLREIGAIIGVSESRVSQIHAQAMQHLKAKMRCVIEENAQE